jgi:hypothetical protein
MHPGGRTPSIAGMFALSSFLLVYGGPGSAEGWAYFKSDSKGTRRFALPSVTNTQEGAFLLDIRTISAVKIETIQPTQLD